MQIVCVGGGEGGWGGNDPLISKPDIDWLKYRQQKSNIDNSLEYIRQVTYSS